MNPYRERMAEFTYPDLRGIEAGYDPDGYVIVRGVLEADLVRELTGTSTG